MMRTLFLLGWMSLILASSAWGGEARATARYARQLFEKDDFRRAAEQYDKAAELAATERLDPAVAQFNQGTALLRAEDYREADAALSRALRSPDLALQSRAYFNRGNALAGQAQAAGNDEKGLDSAIQSLEQALVQYESAMRLLPDDEDPKINFELATQKLDELKRQREEQKNQQQEQPKQDPQSQQNQQSQDDQSEQEQEQPDRKPEQPEPSRPEESEQQEPSGDTEQTDQQSSGQAENQQANASEAESKGEMTQEEARMLLDAMKQEEMSQRDRMRLFLGKPQPVNKDW